MRRLFCALALGLSAQPAFAQSAGPDVVAYNLIEGAQAQGVFELVHNGGVTVRHVGSGLVCHFQRDGEGGRLILYPGLPRGDNVSCDSQTEGEYLTLYATRFQLRTNLDEQIAGAAEAIRNRFPDAAFFAAPSEDPPDALPPRRHAQFIVTLNGERTYTRASVAQVGDWIIKLRYSARAADDAAAVQGEIRSSALFEAALREMTPPPNL